MTTAMLPRLEWIVQQAHRPAHECVQPGPCVHCEDLRSYYCLYRLCAAQTYDDDSGSALTALLCSTRTPGRPAKFSRRSLEAAGLSAPQRAPQRQQSTSSALRLQMACLGRQHDGTAGAVHEQEGTGGREPQCAAKSPAVAAKHSERLATAYGMSDGSSA